MAADDRGWVHPELVLHTALANVQATVDAAAAVSQAEVDRLLKRIYHNETQANRDVIRDWLAGNRIPVMDAFPREPVENPCWVVFLQSENEEHFVGGVSHVAEFVDGYSGTMEAESQDAMYGVATITENARLTRWLYRLSFWGMASQRRWFDEQIKAMEPLRLSGRDLIFDPNYMQAGKFLYRRDLNLRTKYLAYDAEREAELGDQTDEDVCVTADGQIETGTPWAPTGGE